MRLNSNPSVILLAALFGCAALLAGCVTDKAKAYKMHQTSGKMTRGSDVGYWAVCTNIIAGSHAEVWNGTVYPEKERAMRDAVQHNKQNPGHDATIRH